MQERFGDTVRNNHRAEGGVARGEALGRNDDVGNKVVLLSAEPGAETSVGADHLVRDEQHAVAVTDLTNLL